MSFVETLLSYVGMYVSTGPCCKYCMGAPQSGIHTVHMVDVECTLRRFCMSNAGRFGIPAEMTARQFLLFWAGFTLHGDLFCAVSLALG